MGTRPQGRSCYMKLFLRILYRASYLCLKVMPGQASRIQCETKAAVPYPPTHTPSEPHFFSFAANVSIMLALLQE